MHNSKVLVLLATYNGEPYIRQMIDSVLAQDYPYIQIVLSDDNSKDGTAQILEEYETSYPDRITHYRSGQRFGSAQKHFMHLLKQFHDAPYIMFCDQDDIWHSDKVRKTLNKMLEIEADENTPALVHTDLKVVNQELQEIAPSFCGFSGLDGNRMKLNQLLVQNVVTGCTMMINRSLAVLACRDVPMEKIRMHDWWLALLASATGTTGFVDEATIDYRQHGSNSVGAKNIRSPQYIWKRLRSDSMRQGLMLAADQAEAFLNCYNDVLDENGKRIISAFVKTPKKNLFGRDLIYLKYGLLKHGVLRIITQLLGL